MADQVFTLAIDITTDKAVQQVNNLNKALTGLQNTTTNINKTAGAGFTGLTKSVSTATTAFGALGSVITAIGFGKIAQDIVKIAGNYEQLKTTLTTVTGSLEGSAKALATIQAVSKGTGFSIDDIGKSFIGLQVNGIDPTKERLQLFADVSSIATNKLEALNAISEVFARNAAGGLNLEDLNRLANQGIPVFDILKQRLNLTRGELSELGRNAEGANIILRALEDGLSQRFGGAAARNVNDLNGQIGLLKNNLAGLAAGVGEGGLTKGLTDLLSVLNQVVAGQGENAKTVGKVFGDALTGIAKLIVFIQDHGKEIAQVLAIIVAILLRIPPAATAAVETTTVATTSASATVAAVAAETEALGVATTAAASRAGIAATAWAGFNTVLKGISTTLMSLGQRYPLLSSLGILIGAGTIANKISPDKLVTKSSLPGNIGEYGNEAAQSQRRSAEEIRKDQERALDLATGRSVTVNKILESLKQETVVIGKTKQQAEELARIEELRRSMKDKLVQAGRSEAEAEEIVNNQLSKTVDGVQQVAEIRSAVARKYAAESRFQFSEMVKNNTFEISLLGQSSNEIERQTKLRDYLVSIGKRDTASQKEKLDILKEIDRLQEMQISDRLQKNLEGIRREVEYLKMSNEERERAQALEQAATEAGFKNREQLIKARPLEAAQINRAVREQQQETVNKAGRDQIDILRDQLTLQQMQIDNYFTLDDLQKQTIQNQQQIYRQIDPNGKGKNITDQQKAEIDNLLQQIEAQNRLIELNKQIGDSFTNLGNDVTKAMLGNKDAVKQLELELIKLAALEAFKYFNGGLPSGALGQFFTGLIGGLSGGRASGGPVTAGQSYMVGENGRAELFVPQTNGYVVPINQTPAQASTTHITIAPQMVVHGGVTGQRELDKRFEEFAYETATQIQTFVINQTGQQGIIRGR